jgi:hypothetical protein
LRTASNQASSSNSRSSGARNSIAAAISKIIISDDREEDRGLASVRIVDAGGLDIIAPSISAGAPQAEIILNENAQRASGRAILELTDVAGNIKQMTLCFSKDQLGADNLVSLSDGVQDYCPKRTLWYWGAFGTFAATWHTASFSRVDGFQVPSAFGNSGSGAILPVGGGLVLGHRLSPLFGVSLKLTGEGFPGSLRAPDPANADSRRDTLVLGLDGRPSVLQQGYSLALTSVYASLALAGELYLTNNLYAFAGLKASLAITRTITLNRVIITPKNFVYPRTNSGEQEIFSGASQSLASVLPSAFGGVGVTIPIWRNIAGFAELHYTYGLGTVLDGQEWRVNQLGLNIGARMRF